MKRTLWFSVALIGLMVTGCGGGGSDSSSSTDSDRAKAQSVSTISGDCAQLSGFFNELLSLTNKARQDEGLHDLRFSYALGQAAQGYAEELATQNFFSHTGKDGSTLRSRIDAAGYDYATAGENLGAGQTTARGVFRGWMNSAGHRANILQEGFTEVGFGLFDTTGSSDYGTYWVQNFGKPNQDSSSPGIYIPDVCSYSNASGDRASNQTVAGISITNELNGERKAFEGHRVLPGSVQTNAPLQLTEEEALPTAVLSAALANNVQLEESTESVPEPAALLGLAAVSLALWYERYSK